jgi:hypothetical protein
VIQTDNYRRFERVDSVEETPTGVLGQTHGEMLRIDLVREDVVRVNPAGTRSCSLRCPAMRWMTVGRWSRCLPPATRAVRTQ